MIVYGTPEELAAWVDPDTEPPAPVPLATVLLRAATQTVLDYSAGAVYATDAEGIASKTEVHDALLSATLEQAATLHANDIDPRKGASAVQRRVASKSLNGASISYVADAKADTYLSDLAAGALARSAWLILSNAGLLTNRVQTRDHGNLGASYGVPYNPLTGKLQR